MTGRKKRAISRLGMIRLHVALWLMPDFATKALAVAVASPDPKDAAKTTGPQGRKGERPPAAQRGQPSGADAPRPAFEGDQI